ncbi:hypothetical protein ACLM5H_07375 [Fredinandcohnia humi]
MKKLYLILVLVAVCGFVYYLLSNEKLYGNDEESIIQVIKSIEGYEAGTVELLEVKDIGKDRFVSFLYNNSPAYIQFVQNSRKDYEWRHVEKSEGEFFASYLPNISDGGPLKFLIVTNEDNNVARLELNVNGHIIEAEFPENQKYVSWISLPKSNGSYTFAYKYFDKYGNLIEEL